MPTREAIVESVLPQTEPKPIPTRVVQTRAPTPKKVEAQAPIPQNGNQTIPVEGNPAAVPATTEDPIRLSPAASALARKEQQFRQREQAFKADQDKFASYKEKAEKFDQLSERLKAKDFKAAEELGLNYEEYVQYQLTQANGEDPVAQKFAALEARITELTKGQEENLEQQFEATVADYRKEVSALVESSAEFASLKHLGKEAIDGAVQLIVDSWEEDELEMTPEQACRDIKKEILEIGKKFIELPDLKPAPAAQPQVELPPPKQGVSTLTNGMQPPSGEPPKKALQYLSETERYAEARRRVLARRAQQS